VVIWVSATIRVPARVVERESVFWTSVTGSDLPAHLQVGPGSGAAEVGVGVHDGDVPAVPEPASFQGVRRSRVYQVCLDIPAVLFDSETERWAGMTAGKVEVLGRRPEFAWLRIPGGPRPLDVLLQRLDRSDGPVSAHVDVGTPDRQAETQRHVALGATVLAQEEFWTVLADPAGLPYCITDRDPASGELA